MSALLYTLLCALGSLLVIALADQVYKSIRSKWADESSLARETEAENNTLVAPLIASSPPIVDTSLDNSSVGGQSTSQSAATDVDLEAYAKSLLNDTKKDS